eukprot:2285724-Karenia_brevis.AAC.1
MADVVKKNALITAESMQKHMSMMQESMLLHSKSTSVGVEKLVAGVCCKLDDVERMCTKNDLKIKALQLS